MSGAGPAGLTVAYWLKRCGFNPTIVERAPHLLVGGYKIDVRGAALQVIKQMGIHDAIVAARTDMQGAQLVDKQGNVLERMSGDATTRSRMEPRGRKRHRWANPRGRNERERLSQNFRSSTNHRTRPR